MKSPLAILAFAGVAACARPGITGDRAAPASPDPLAFCWLDKQLGRRPTTVVDLRLRTGEGNRRPDAADSIAVLSRGGRILYAFSVAVLRVAVDTAALRALIAGPSAIAHMAYVVRDTTKHDVSLQIFFNRPLRTTDSLRVVGLGGAVGMFREGHHGPLNAYLADSAVSQVMSLQDVTLVRAAAMECVQVGALRPNEKLKPSASPSSLVVFFKVRAAA